MNFFFVGQEWIVGCGSGRVANLRVATLITGDPNADPWPRTLLFCASIFSDLSCQNSAAPWAAAFDAEY